MRICLVNTFHYRRGGDSTYAFDLASLLEARGHEVVHFAMRHPQNVASRFDPYFVDPVDFREISQKSGVVAKLAALPRSFYSLDARRKFARLLDATRPDLVHLQNFRRHLTFSILGQAKQRGLPIVRTAHDYDTICPSSLLFARGKVCDACRGRAYYRAAIMRCKDDSLMGSLAVAAEGYFARVMRYYGLVDLTITPSRFAKSKMVECGQDERTIRVIPNFMDGSLYRPRYANDGYILTSGRLSPEKGLEVLMEALERAPTTRLMVAGDGACRRPLEQLAVKLGLKNVEFLGYVPRERLVELLAGSKYMVMPSISPENFPYAALEAFALGKPVIASRIGGLPEIVEDGRTGLLFEPGDAAGLADRMRMLDAAPALIGEMGRNARRRIETEFDAATHYASITRVYNELRG